MKSIEERAREHASSIAGGIYHGGLRGSVYEHNYHNYIQIANEQAEITKKEMIEKACNVYADLLSAHGYNPIDVNNEVVRMKKELEE